MSRPSLLISYVYHTAPFLWKTPYTTKRTCNSAPSLKRDAPICLHNSWQVFHSSAWFYWHWKTSAAILYRTKPSPRAICFEWCRYYSLCKRSEYGTDAPHSYPLRQGSDRHKARCAVRFRCFLSPSAPFQDPSALCSTRICSLQTCPWWWERNCPSMSLRPT